MKSLVMVLLSLLVAGAMAIILFNFLKKLKKIEYDFWGATSAEAQRQLDEARAKLFAEAQAKSGKKKK